MLNKRILVLMFVVAFLFVGCLPTVTPPIIENQAPVITSDSVTTATVRVAYTYDVEATDPDGDTLTYSLDVKPGGMTIDSETGVIKWTPYSTQVGEQKVTVKVSDGTLTDTQSFTIVVSVAEAPGYAPPEEEEEEEFVGGGYVPTPLVVTLAEIPGVTAPVTGATPVTTITGTAQYTGAVTWDPADAMFAGETVYTATITLTAKVGFTLIGVAANFFTVDGATATNPINSGIVTAVFPVTAARELDHIVVDPKTIAFEGKTGDTRYIYSVTAHYNDGTSIVIEPGNYDYGSAHPSIATVYEGHSPLRIIVKSVECGATTITVTYNGETDTVEVTVGRVHNVTEDTYYYNIQDAIDNASALAGTLIDVAAGTYYENVYVNKSLTLQGEDRETTEIISGYVSYPSEPPLTILVDGVTVSGFTIHSGPYIEAGLGATGGYAHTIIVDGDSALLTDLYVIKDLLLTYNNNPREGGSAFWLASSIDGFTLTDSIVESEWNGIYMLGGGNDIKVRNVDFTYLGQWAIMVKQITGATIEANTFTNPGNQLGVLVSRGCEGIEIMDNKFTGSGSTDSSHIGILLQNFKTGPVGVSILGNDISDFDTGIKVEENVATSGISIHDNNIFSNVIGVNNDAATGLDATNNWWGDTSGPKHPISNPLGAGNAVSDNVGYKPFSGSSH